MVFYLADYCVLNRKKNTADYHDEMNSETILDWMESVLARFHVNCIIVLDNVPYHSVKVEKVPTTTRKADIIKCLEDKGEVID